jgi:hypothetical protein
MEVGTIQTLNAVEDDGSEVIVYFVPLILTKAEADDLVSRYDPNSGTSPSVADARPLARVILNAVRIAP